MFALDVQYLVVLSWDRKPSWRCEANPHLEWVAVPALPGTGGPYPCGTGWVCWITAPVRNGPSAITWSLRYPKTRAPGEIPSPLNRRQTLRICPVLVAPIRQGSREAGPQNAGRNTPYHPTTDQAHQGPQRGPFVPKTVLPGPQVVFQGRTPPWSHGLLPGCGSSHPMWRLTVTMTRPKQAGPRQHILRGSTSCFLVW